MTKRAISLLLSWLLISASGAAYAQDAPPDAAAPAPAAPALSGRLRCQGKTMDGEPTYAGEVYVVPLGEVYLVTWEISSNLHSGLAIERDGHLAVIYLTPDKSAHGIALYQRRGEAWEGVWVGAGGGSLAREVWTP